MSSPLPRINPPVSLAHAAAESEPQQGDAQQIAPGTRDLVLRPRAESGALEPYKPPVPGRTWRTFGRFSVLLGGSAAIGVAVATGGVSFAAASLAAVGLATAQVLAQTWRQNRLGQAVVGGIAQGDLDKARSAAERAVIESPAGVMRTLAASNLASVLIQQDRIADAARILDLHPPGLFHMPLATVLWLNNRAFAYLATEDTVGQARATQLLDEAERRLTKATPRDLGGPANARKLLSALAGTRAIERATHKDGKAALAHLERARKAEDSGSTPYRTAERELCRVEALRLVGRLDEAKLALEALAETRMTGRQHARWHRLREMLGLEEHADVVTSQANAVDDDA